MRSGLGHRIKVTLGDHPCPTVDDINPAVPEGLKDPNLWELCYIPYDG